MGMRTDLVPQRFRPVGLPPQPDMSVRCMQWGKLSPRTVFHEERLCLFEYLALPLTISLPRLSTVEFCFGFGPELFKLPVQRSNLKDFVDEAVADELRVLREQVIRVQIIGAHKAHEAIEAGPVD